MRIAHLVLSRGFAGTERSTVNLCNEQARSHEVALVVRSDHRRAGISILDHVDPRVRVYEVNRWLAGWGVRRALADFAPDVAHAHLRRSTRILARQRPPFPIVSTLHMSWDGWPYLKMDGLICIADWQVAMAPAGFAGELFRIDESIDLAKGPRPAAGAARALREELGIAPHEHVFGAVGRLSPVKGFDVLIRAFERAALPDARLVIVGDGREREKLQRLAGPGVQLLGHRRDVLDLYAMFDSFVCPSRHEPLGLVMLEAYAAGLPVIASDTGGPGELVRRLGGDLVVPEDVEALAQALRRHHAQRPPRREVDLSMFDIGHIAQQVEAAYRRLIEAKQGGRGNIAAPVKDA